MDRDAYFSRVSSFSLASQAVERRFVSGRGGDVFVVPKKGFEAGHSAVLFPKDSAPSASRMPDVAAADVLAQRVGLPLLRSDVASEHFVASKSALRRASSAAVLAVAGVGAPELAHFRGLRCGGELRRIEETAVLQDNVALLSTLLSGANVASHGIVGRSYFDGHGLQHAAFSEAASARKIPALADRLIAARSAASSWVASTDAALAGALGPLSSAPRSSLLTWSAELRRFVQTVPRGPAAPSLDLSFPRLVAILGAVRTPEAVELAFHGRHAKFLMSHPSDLAFLAELELLLTRTEALRNKDVSMPAFFGFAFGSLEHFRRYGLTSEKFEVALRAVDEAMAQCLEVVSAHGAAWQLIYLDQANVVQQGLDVISSLSPQLDSLSSLTAFGIDIFANADSKSVCVALNKLLWTLDAVAYCPTGVAAGVSVGVSAPAVVHEERQGPNGTTLTTTTTTAGAGGTTTSGSGATTTPASTTPPATPPYSDDLITDQDVFAFQIFFWMVVVLFLTFLFAASTISSIGIPNDSPLLRNLPDIYRAQGQIMREIM